MLSSLPAADGRGAGLSEMDGNFVYLVYASATWNEKAQEAAGSINRISGCKRARKGDHERSALCSADLLF